MTKKIKSGFAIHCHHNILVEYCYDYDERINAIKSGKPLSEQETRLRLFKILPKEALKDISIRLQKAYAEWEKADAKWEKAYIEWKKAYAEWEKADAKWEKAYIEWKKAYAEWDEVDQNIFHKKWCGCKEWDGKKILFNGK